MCTNTTGGVLEAFLNDHKISLVACALNFVPSFLNNVGDKLIHDLNNLKDNLELAECEEVECVEQLICECFVQTMQRRSS